MNRDYLPKTESELANWMKENCFNFNSYSIGGNSIYEGFGIDCSEGSFVWYYIERGKKEIVKYFRSESEVVEYAFNQINSDKWASAHCIGFSTDKALISELKSTLDRMSTAFFEDTIPYYGKEKPVYRVFVSGCDIRKTEHLKEKYYTEK